MPGRREFDLAADEVYFIKAGFDVEQFTDDIKQEVNSKIRSSRIFMSSSAAFVAEMCQYMTPIIFNQGEVVYT